MSMLLSPSELASTATIDPAIEAFAKLISPPDAPAPDPTDFHAIRATLNTVETANLAASPRHPEEIHEEPLAIPARDGHPLPALLHRPLHPSPGAKSPLIMLVFGGGFAAGSNRQFVPLARLLVRLYRAVVVCTSYRLAPEAVFPAQCFDSWDSLVHLSRHGHLAPFDADPAAGFVVGGGSAGAQVAATLSLKAAREPEALGARLTGQWLNIPAVLPGHLVPERFRPNFRSMEQNAAPPYNFLGVKEIEAFVAMNGWDDASALRTPLTPFSNAVPHPNLVGPEGEKAWLPRAFIQVSGLDPLRDDGLVYGAMLEEAGVEVRAEVARGAPHGHLLWWPGLGPGAVEGNVKETVAGFGWLLGVEKGEEVERVVRDGRV